MASDRTDTQATDPGRPRTPNRPRPPATDAIPLDPPDRPGDLGRLGRLRVVAQVGRGGMGAVYWAEDPDLGRAVAVKMLHPELACEPASVERFLREARAAAGIYHPNVVAIYEVGTSNGSPYLVMPLLAGGTLAAWLDHAGPVRPPAEWLPVAVGIADGLAAAHDRGVIHRDVKPTNVWLEPGPPPSGVGGVKLLDFGLARSVDAPSALTAPGTALGTPGYMAPEQAHGLPLDARADLFGVGCILYELATGVQAFDGLTHLAIIKRTVGHHPDPPAAVNPAVPVGLSNLILRLLAKDPGGRPANARVVADELRAIASQLAAAPPPPSAPPSRPTVTAPPSTPRTGTAVRDARPAPKPPGGAAAGRDRDAGWPVWQTAALVFLTAVVVGAGVAILVAALRPQPVVAPPSSARDPGPVSHPPTASPADPPSIRPDFPPPFPFEPPPKGFPPHHKKDFFKGDKKGPPPKRDRSPPPLDADRRPPPPREAPPG